MGSLLLLKMLGPMLIAVGRGGSFVQLFGQWVICAVAIALAAVTAAFWFRQEVAADYGESACVYAAVPGCTGLYAAIMQGKDSLEMVFGPFGPTVGLQLLLELFRAGLAACRDFSYLAVASVAALLAVYFPSLLVARYMFDGTAQAYYIAMYMPHFAMVFLFGRRLRVLLIKLLAHECGPWSEQNEGLTLSEGQSVANGRDGGASCMANTRLL
eukprot:SAG31_NODE_2135_length_6364_cov_4.367438_7_plen_213_part_00